MKKTESPAMILQARALDPKDLPPIDAHIHTSWTDGKPTVREAYDRASAIGLKAILFSEHSRRTSTSWFPDFAAEVRALPTEPCRAFVGTEVKVELVDGAIDTIPEISSLCDFVMASVHRFPNPDGQAVPFETVDPAEAVEREFDLSWAALGNPRVDILGHMFGMSFRRFKVTPPAERMRSLIERAAETRVAVEINAHYHPDPLLILNWCREFDALITFGSNAHDLDGIGSMTRLLAGQNAG